MRIYLKIYLNIISLSLLVLFAAPATAQRYIGIATCNWSAINSVYLNPASIADCREQYSIGILSLNGAVDNNLGFIPHIPDAGTAISNSKNVFTESGRKSFSMMVPMAEVRGPGIMISAGKKVSVALTTDIRGINQFNNFDPTLYNALSLNGSLPTQDYNVDARNFNWTAHLWSELGLSLGAVVYEGYRDRLNIGFTVRRLGGIGYISLAGKNMDIYFRKQTDSFSAENSDLRFASNVTDGNSTVLKDITPSGLFSKFFGGTAGSGVGGDAGITYRYRIGEADRSDYMESNKVHDLILSVAVTDIGAINYFNSSSKVIHVTGNGNLAGEGLTGSTGSIDSFVSFARKQGFYVDTIGGTKRVTLPTAFVASLDAQIQGRFFANLLYVANLADRNNFGNSYYNQVTLTPRYDFHKMTIALPLTYSMLAHDFKAGFAVRYSGFFLGSDDALALFNKYNYGFSIYVGGYVPIFKKDDDPVGLHWGVD